MPNLLSTYSASEEPEPTERPAHRIRIGFISWMHCRKALILMPDPNLEDRAFVAQLAEILGQTVHFERGPLPRGQKSLWAHDNGDHAIIVAAELSPIVALFALFDATARPLLDHHNGRAISQTQQDVEAQYVTRSLVRRILRADLQASAHDRIFAEVAGTQPLEGLN